MFNSSKMSSVLLDMTKSFHTSETESFQLSSLMMYQLGVLLASSNTRI